MALAITKNDISGVYGNPAPLKITKSDISSVYTKREKPKQPVILRATPEESHSSKTGTLRSDRQNMRYFAPLRSTQYDTPGQSSVILNEAKRSELAVCRGRQLVCRPRANARYGGARASQRLQPEESHSHKTGTLSDTSPFTITKSDISTIYSAPKTADAKTDRIHKMYSDYVKKQEEEIKSNQLIPEIKDVPKGLSNIEKIKNYFPEELLLNRRTKKRESMIMMEGFRNDDKPMGFFHLDEPHDVDGKPVGYHINTLKDKEFDWVTLTPLQEKTLKKLSHKEIPESVYNAFKNFDDVAKNIKSAGKAAAVAGIVFDTYEFAKTAYNDLTDEDGKLGQDTAEMVAGAAAGWAGGAIGTKLGAVGGSAIGTAICPGLGTVIGGFIGGSFGGIIGSTAGRESGEFLVNEIFGE